MRIIYWNNACLQPEIEAVSKEVFQLARHFPRSLIFGINPHYICRASIKKKYIGFHPNFDLVLRLLIPYIERYGDISHVYGEATCWTFSKALRRKPLVLTIASEKGCVNTDFIARCRKVLVQTEPFREKLLASGVEKEKIEVVFPSVDLQAFRPLTQAPKGMQTPKILFATAPRSAEELEGRGVRLLLQAAQKSPDIQYHLLFRVWQGGYTSLATTTKWIATDQLHNVTLTNSIVDDMPQVYNDHHFTVIPYTHPGGGKECPTSLIEGLACGLPALISSVAPFAYFVEKYRCGVAFEPTPHGLVSAVELGMRSYANLSANAVRVARGFFSEELLWQRMERIYQEVLL